VFHLQIFISTALTFLCNKPSSWLPFQKAG
jgi:hypothetical protein